MSKAKSANRPGRGAGKIKVKPGMRATHAKARKKRLPQVTDAKARAKRALPARRGRRLKPQGPGVRPAPKTAPLGPPSSPSDPNRVNNAEWTLCAYFAGRSSLDITAFDGKSRTSRRLHLMSLPDAIVELARDHGQPEMPDHHAWPRRASALRRLVGAGWANAAIVESWAVHFDRRSLVEHIKGSVVFLADSVGIGLQQFSNTSPDAAQIAVDQQLVVTATTANECIPMNAACSSVYDGLTGRTTVTATCSVARPASAVAKAFDPRAWAACDGAFERSDLVRPVSYVGPIHDTYDHDGRLNAVPFGGLWTALVPPEYWRIQEVVKVGPFRFDNILYITQFAVTATHVHVAFRLAESFDVGNGELVQDWGTIDAGPGNAAGVTDITVVKTVKFADLTTGPGGTIDYGELPNWMAPAALCMWLGTQAHQGPCCSP